MELNDTKWPIFSWNRWKSGDISKKVTWKVVENITFENNNIIAFEWVVIHPNCTSGSKIAAMQKLGDKKADFSTKFQPYPTDHQRQVNFAKLPGNV